jgi:DNA-directed RNA polymerase subunit RPC12/RpoP
MYCHDCAKNFIAELDFSISGNHVVECPHCGHEHCRVIKDGKITEDRFNSTNGLPKVTGGSTWKSSVLPLKTSTAAAFLRDKWLNLTQ